MEIRRDDLTHRHANRSITSGVTMRHLQRWLWAALGCFILAGSTGALFRFGMALGGLPFGLDFGNVRDGHSHLMYFGWVTPALMALIATHLSAATGRGLRRSP